ncbi:MAG: type I methionyl aminopeptidase [Metamycoplasmataceae bacterium]
MIHIKSEKEVELIKKSCEILANVKKILFDAVRPGISLKELDSIAFNEIIKLGAKPAFLGYNGFKGTICASVNEELIHGIPSNRILKNNDLLKIDVGCIYEGYYSDSAFSKSVGTSTQENDFLISVAEEAFKKGLDAIKPGATTGDISYEIGEFIKKNNLFTPKEFSGHGIGRSLHEDPYVFNEGTKGSGVKLVDNMVICIEPMILQKSNKIKILKDGWTVVSPLGLKTSHYEQTVLIKNGKGIVLTK